MRALHSGQVGDVDLHKIGTGKTKATPSQTSAIERKTAVPGPQRASLSGCIGTCQPNMCQRKTGPCRRSAIYRVYTSSTEMRDDVKALWFNTKSG